MNINNFAGHIYRICNIPIAVGDLFGQVESVFSGYLETVGMLELDAGFIEKNKGTIQEENPMLTQIQEGIFGAVIRSPQGKLCVLGPVAVFFYGVKEQKQLKEQYHYPQDKILRVMECDFQHFCNVVSMVYEFMTGQQITMYEILEHNRQVKEAVIKTSLFIQKSILERSEENDLGGALSHNSYTQERLEQECITNGDVEGLKKAIEAPLNGQLGILAKEKMRSNKNLCIVVVAISSRAALRGGVHSELVYSLSDRYINMIEEENNIANLYYIARNAEMDFARLVKEYKERKIRVYPLVDKCIDLIIENIHNKISVAELAEALNVSPNYLSKVFHEKMGETIVDYSKKTKIQMAKTQLLYTDIPLKEIAYSLGFSSQSHFGKVFKDVTGMTPLDYKKGIENPEKQE